METTPAIQDFGARLRLLRGHRRLTWAGLAEAAGCHVDALHRISRGESADPRLSTLCGLADALGVTLDQLAGRAPLPKKILENSLDTG
jgi:transcriptional regulator with XRE-family HTH domain